MGLEGLAFLFLRHVNERTLIVSADRARSGGSPRLLRSAVKRRRGDCALTSVWGAHRARVHHDLHLRNQPRPSRFSTLNFRGSPSQLRWHRGDKSHAEGRLADRLAHYAKPKLPIIDELGYLPFDKRAVHLLFQLIVRRYERTATLITTNQMVTQWGAVFGDEMIAAAMLDRLLHHSQTLVIQGDSYRMREKRKAGLWTPPTEAR